MPLAGVHVTWIGGVPPTGDGVVKLTGTEAPPSDDVSTFAGQVSVSVGGADGTVGESPPHAKRVTSVAATVFRVIHRRRAQLDREPDALAGPELAGVQPRVEPGSDSGGQDVTGLVDVEGATIAEHVDPAGMRCAGLHHLTGDQVDLRRAVVAELRRNDMRA